MGNNIWVAIGQCFVSFLSSQLHMWTGSCSQWANWSVFQPCGGPGETGCRSDFTLNIHICIEEKEIGKIPITATISCSVPSIQLLPSLRRRWKIKMIQGREEGNVNLYCN
jgi:hypothetical protein